MTWVLVVAAVVALAIAVHFYEKRRERVRKARRQARVEQEQRERHRFSLTRQIKEQWEADFETMKLRVTRVDDAQTSPARLDYALERDAAGVWLMLRTQAASETPSKEEVPPVVAHGLETQYQRFLATGSR